MREQYRTSCQIEEEKWGSFLGFGDWGVADYALIGGGEFGGADIEPMGLGGEFHDTGIQVPEPGRVWNPVQIERRSYGTGVSRSAQLAAEVWGSGRRQRSADPPELQHRPWRQSVFLPVTSFRAIADAFHACELARWSSSREV